MKKLTKKSLDELALVMPEISEKLQKGFVGGTGSLLGDLWNATPDGTNSTYVNNNSGSFSGDNYSAAYTTGDTISDFMGDFYNSGNSPTGDIMANFSGDTITGEDIWNQSLYRNISEVNIFQTVWQISQYSKFNSIDGNPKEANAIILDDGQFVIMDIDNNTSTSSSFNY